MPQGTVPGRAQRIRDLGAECDILDVNYDRCVEIARDMAKTMERGLYIQDTALETDMDEERKIPLAIMQVDKMIHKFSQLRNRNNFLGLHDNTDRVSRADERRCSYSCVSPGWSGIILWFPGCLPHPSLSSQYS